MRQIVDEAMESGGIGFATSNSLGHFGAHGLPVPSRLASLDEMLHLVGVEGWRVVYRWAACQEWVRVPDPGWRDPAGEGCLTAILGPAHRSAGRDGGNLEAGARPERGRPGRKHGAHELHLAAGLWSVIVSVDKQSTSHGT